MRQCATEQLHRQCTGMEGVTRALNKCVFKTTIDASKATDPSGQPCSGGFLPPFLMEERFPITSKLLAPYSLGLHRSTKEDTLFTNLFFLFENSPKLFHYLLHIKLDLKSKPGFRRVNAVETFSTSCIAAPRLHLHPHPAYCFRTQEGCALPSSLFPPLPPFTTYNSISRHHNLSISLPRPLGLRWIWDLSLN